MEQESIESAAPNLTVEQAIANLTDPDTSLRYYAAWWLGHYEVKLPKAIELLMAALEDEDDRTELGGYPLRRNAARALGKVGNEQAILPLIKCLQCADFYVREAAAQSLGKLGDRRAIPALMELLAEGLSAAEPVAGMPHLKEPVEAVIETLGALKATEAISLIRPFLEHSLPRVQYSTARAMYQLTGESIYGEKLVQALNGANIQLRRMALTDLGAIGYLPAAKAIASAPAENSFKLIALKGLLEYEIKKTSDRTLSVDAVMLMELMDQLL